MKFFSLDTTFYLKLGISLFIFLLAFLVFKDEIVCLVLGSISLLYSFFSSCFYFSLKQNRITIFSAILSRNTTMWIGKEVIDIKKTKEQNNTELITFIISNNDFFNFFYPTGKNLIGFSKKSDKEFFELVGTGNWEKLKNANFED